MPRAFQPAVRRADREAAELAPTLLASLIQSAADREVAERRALTHLAPPSLLPPPWAAFASRTAPPEAPVGPAAPPSAPLRPPPPLAPASAPSPVSISSAAGCAGVVGAGRD